MAETFRPLKRGALPLDTTALARFLIGATLVHDLAGVRLAGRIVETEAYLPGDAASHAFRGQTERNRSMFLPRGHAYVYISYGVWPMLNVTGGPEDSGEAVLLRALEPLAGEASMRRGPAGRRDVARGPGRLARAMGVTLAHDGGDLCAGGPLFLAAPLRPAGAIRATTRIGITKDADRPFRFIEADSAFLSGTRRFNAG